MIDSNEKISTIASNFDVPTVSIVVLAFVTNDGDMQSIVLKCIRIRVDSVAEKDKQ